MTKEFSLYMVEAILNGRADVPSTWQKRIGGYRSARVLDLCGAAKSKVEFIRFGLPS